MRRQKLPAREARKRKKTPADCFTYKAADGRKQYEDAGGDIVQRDKRTLRATRKRSLERS